MAFRIVVIAGHEHLWDVVYPPKEGTPEYYPLVEGQTFQIGRGGPIVGIRLGIPIARRQADLELKDGVVKILDYGSSRGNFERVVSVNGRHLVGDGKQWITLVSGDEIRFFGICSSGEATLRLEEWDE